jgi:hypothetical protein
MGPHTGNRIEHKPLAVKENNNESHTLLERHTCRGAGRIFLGGLHARECRLPTVARLSLPVSHEVEKG